MTDCTAICNWLRTVFAWYTATCDRGVKVYETVFQEYANECRVICEWLYSN